MVKGTQKQMVVVRTNQSHYYEEAYFVLRDGCRTDGEAQDTMIAEANRILDESMLMPQPRRRKRLSRWWAFAIGLGMGIAVGVAVVLLF
jgi:hypothetical protein